MTTYGKAYRPDRMKGPTKTQTVGYRPTAKEKRVWATLQHVLVELYVGRKGKAESEAEAFGADNVGLLIKAGRQNVWLSMARLTVEELDAIEVVFKQAIDSARPVCEYLDTMAQIAYERGDEELPPRLFRLRPALHKKSAVAFVPPLPDKAGDQHEDTDHGGRAAFPGVGTDPTG